MMTHQIRLESIVWVKAKKKKLPTSQIEHTNLELNFEVRSVIPPTYAFQRRYLGYFGMEHKVKGSRCAQTDTSKLMIWYAVSPCRTTLIKAVVLAAEPEIESPKFDFKHYQGDCEAGFQATL
jgi:hypothetical protein